MSDYLEIKLRAPREQEENLTMLLFAHGAEGVQVDDPAIVMQHLDAHDWDASVFDGQTLPTDTVTLRTLLVNDAPRRAAAQALAAEVSKLGVVYSCERCPDVDWQHEWKQGFTGRAVGERLWIAPCWELDATPAGRLRLAVNPGMAFGTGDHDTTEMVLNYCEEYVHPGAHVIDLGCGSGILAIAALLLGAQSAACVDLDPVCADSVREHMVLNNIEEKRMHFYAGDVLSDEKMQRELRQCKANLVLANITADVLCQLAPVVGRFMAHGGYLICSGILRPYAPDVAQALVNAGLTVIKQREKGEWVALVATVSYE